MLNSHVPGDSSMTTGGGSTICIVSCPFDGSSSSSSCWQHDLEAPVESSAKSFEVLDSAMNLSNSSVAANQVDDGVEVEFSQPLAVTVGSDAVAATAAMPASPSGDIDDDGAGVHMEEVSESEHFPAVHVAMPACEAAAIPGSLVEDHDAMVDAADIDVGTPVLSLPQALGDSSIAAGSTTSFTGTGSVAESVQQLNSTELRENAIATGSAATATSATSAADFAAAVLPAQEVGIAPVVYCARCAQLLHQVDDLTQKNLQTEAVLRKIEVVVRDQNQTISEFDQTMDRKLNEQGNSFKEYFNTEFNKFSIQLTVQNRKISELNTSISNQNSQHAREISELNERNNAILWGSNATMTGLKEQIANFHTGIAELRGENTTLKSDVAELRGENTALKSDVAELRGENTVLKSDVAELRGENTALKSDVAELRGENTVLKNQNVTLENQVVLLRGQNVALEARVALLGGQNVTLEARVTELSEQNLTLETRVAELGGQNETLQARVTALSEQNLTLKSDVAVLRGEIQRLHEMDVDIGRQMIELWNLNAQRPRQ